MCPSFQPPGKPAPTNDDLPLELQPLDTQPGSAARRRAARPVNEEEDLADVTFTKPGQSLLTPKSTLDRVASLRGPRTSWRNMRNDFRGLTRHQQLIAKVGIGLVGIVLLVWLSRLAFRAVSQVATRGKTFIGQVSEEVRSQLVPLQQTQQQLLETMRKSWEQDLVENDEPASVAPRRMQAKVLDGEPWPSRERDQLLASDLVEPTTLILDLLKFKGIELTNDGLGVFHTESTGKDAAPEWIGGFGVLQQRGSPSKPLLHGTLVHNATDGSCFVATFRQDRMTQFWCLKGSADNRLVLSSRTVGLPGKVQLDGAAFILDKTRTTCLVLDYRDGELVGGQWCSKHKDDDGIQVYDPPTTIVSASALRSEGADFEEYLAAFDNAVSEVAELQNKATAEMRKFYRSTSKRR